jgi:cell division inhibitor SepF
MSGAMRKIGEYLGLLEDTGRYDEDYSDYETSASPAVPVARQSGRSAVADISERRRPVAPVQSPAAEISRITTITPSNYNEARAVGENFREGTPVIMNLTEMADTDAKRLVDFAAGLVFATHGSIEKVTNKVFLLSPAGFSVGAQAKQQVAESGFFNQS